MTYIEAPQEYIGKGPSVFLAGGITDCRDWQNSATKMLTATFGRYGDENVIFNPRRENFPIDDPSASDAQIAWEFRHLARAEVVLFWFDSGPSNQPIALYELGRHAALGRRLAVGCDPGYLRKTDVTVQMQLARPDLPVFDSLPKTCEHAFTLLSQKL